MAHREFHDARGTLWSVWDIDPTTGGALITHLARRQESPGGECARRVSRAAPEYVAAALAAGWLCFESENEKRRLAPIPDGWQEMATLQLRELCASAAPVSRQELRRA